MTNVGMLQIILYCLTILILIKPLGWYMAMVYEAKPCGLNQLFAPIERFIYKISHVSIDQEMGWKTYLWSMLIFNLLSILIVYSIQRLQFYLPLNPNAFSGVKPDLAFNTALSFATNTNWQAYSGETTMSYLTQMLAFTVQNFLSAATGMSLLVAMIRGIAGQATQKLGNFWVDMVRSTLYILLPLAFILSLVLVSQGVIQNFKPYQTIHLMQPLSPQQLDTQIIPMGPVASQVAIKQLGTNGGGFFNTNAAHPFENPTPLTNFVEMISLLLIPAALCYTFGMLVKDKRQGWALIVAMFIMYLPLTCLTIYQEQIGNPAFAQLGIDQTPQPDLYPGGNMEGKEARFGIVNSGLWAATTTATANGSVNSMLDSYTPLGGLIPLWFMHLGEVVFGGVGSGLYGMLMLVIITVFIAGLMVGRTPEYLGKKIEPFEMKMASIGVLVMPLIVLLFTAIASTIPMGISSISNPGTHGMTEMLYAFTSMVTNNGSSFAGLNANTFFYNTVGGIAILIGRYWLAIPVLALAGSLAKKKSAPSGLGTFTTHTPLFIVLLILDIFILSALSFFPALALGPIVEHLMLWSQYGH
jgi:K+-transporting ATPase ATPase A chain